MDTKEQSREGTSSGPRSLREINEDTWKDAIDFTQSYIYKANTYAREH